MLGVLRTSMKIHRKLFKKGGKLCFGHWQNQPPCIQRGSYRNGKPVSELSWVYQDRVIFIYGRARKTCNLCVYVDLELLGYSGSLTVRNSLAFCAFRSWVGHGELDKYLVATEEENFFPTALSCQALFPSFGPPQTYDTLLCVTINPRN